MPNINYRNLNSNEEYVCNIKDVKKIFRDFEELDISFGFVKKKYEFDGRCNNQPSFSGIIVSSCTTTRQLTQSLYFYAARIGALMEKDKQEYANNILPRIHEWFLSEAAKQETAVLGIEELLIEWTGNEFKEHKLRFL